ncbi:hypothetical protein [Micromonospora haikouensis]|uniref:hypothetical protein n=1 Tax=Micromonospora haikouensis TaxID=686309 RepID=UPI003D73AD34
MAKPRPTLTPPRGIFDEMVDEAGAAPAPAAEPASDAKPEETSPPAAPTQALEVARPGQPAVPDARPATRRQAPPARRSAVPAVPAVRAQSVVVPPAPADFLATKKPLQVKMNPQEHWQLKIGTTLRGRDMSSVATAMIALFNADQDLWLELMDRAAEDRVSLAEHLAPTLEQLRDR